MKAILHILLTLPAIILLTGFGSAVFELDFRVSTNEPILILGCAASVFASIVAAITSFIKPVTWVYKVFSALAILLACLLFSYALYIFIGIAPVIFG
ncbi:MAG TPA: hypothetical protein PK369_09580 [Thermoclostridium sp.]|jgi:hypothetical protein|nr:hypothetical protein [Clostridiaceae bacterium]HOQ76803.1 hypothetical protein [Thermoclostridium sp.]